MKKTLSRLGISLAATGFSLSSIAAPWLDTTDNYLRQSLQTLSHAGLIKGPVNTYPIMWLNIAADLQQAQDHYPQDIAFALAHVRSALTINQQDYIAGIKLKASSDPSLYQSFGESYFEEASASVFKEYLGNKWAAKTQINYRKFDNDGSREQNVTYDGSYLAAILGNWVLAADQIPLWWGPGQQTALLLSNNARPLPAVRLTRHNWQATDNRWFNWLGPWTFTTFFGIGEHATDISQIRYWGARFSARPLPQLEVGLSRISQWGGQGLDNSFGAWKDMLLLQDSTDDRYADNMASLDLTYHTRLLERPLSLYMELADDNGTDRLSKPMQLFGVRTFVGNENGIHTLNLEWSDTYIRCDDAQQAGQCAYSGNLYPQGYRRYNRIIGSGYGNDAKILSSGYRYQTYEGYSWAVSVLHGKFYQSANTLKNWQLRLEYRQPLFNGLLSIEGRVFDKSPQPQLDIKRGSIAATWEYRF